MPELMKKIGTLKARTATNPEMGETTRWMSQSGGLTTCLDRQLRLFVFSIHFTLTTSNSDKKKQQLGYPGGFLSKNNPKRGTNSNERRPTWVCLFFLGSNTANQRGVVSFGVQCPNETTSNGRFCVGVQ